LMHATPSGCESMAMELAELAVKLRGGNKPKDPNVKPMAQTPLPNATTVMPQPSMLPVQKPVEEDEFVY
jgi:hypothetical protein